MIFKVFHMTGNEEVVLIAQDGTTTPHVPTAVLPLKKMTQRVQRQQALLS
jgi:hypothetical protein